MSPKPSSDRSRQFQRMVAGIPNLTLDEEIDLHGRWVNDHDVAARDKLIAASLKMSVALATKLGRSNPSRLDDLISAGFIGIMKALKRYDPSFRKHFILYSWHWIRNEMTLLNLAENSVVQGGKCVRGDILFRILRERAEIEKTVQDREEVCAKLSVKLGETVEVTRAWMNRLDQPDMSLDYEYEDGLTFGEAIETPGETPEQSMVEDDFAAHYIVQIHDAIDQLDPRKREIIQRRYLNDPGESLAAIGVSFRVSRERVRQLEKIALRTLRDKIVIDGRRPDKLAKILKLLPHQPGVRLSRRALRKAA